MLKKVIIRSLAVLLLFPAFAAMSANETGNDARDVVRDTRSNIVNDTKFGTCVRTQWNNGQDPCAPQQVAEKPHIKKARELATEDRTVYFEFNHAELLPEERAKLDSLAEVLRSDNTVKDVRIAGYADRIGSVSYNSTLSKRRAKNVEKYLHQRHYLNTSLAKVRWLGKSESVTQCSGKLKRKELIACLQKDRRVVVDIDYYPAEK